MVNNTFDLAKSFLKKVVPSSAGLSGVVQPQHQQKNTSATQKLRTVKTLEQMHITVKDY
jgi:hypothetical protein